MAEFGRLDILVNCAAVIGRGDFFSLDEAKWAQLFDDKLDGTARCIRLAVPLMRQRKWGRIVNVLGGAARQPQPAAVSVGLNNAAILNLIKAIAGDLAKDNILINAVIPSVIHSERLDETIRAEAARTGKSEAEMRAQRGRPHSARPHGRRPRGRRRRRLPRLGAGELRHRQRLGRRRRRGGGDLRA